MYFTDRCLRSILLQSRITLLVSPLAKYNIFILHPYLNVLIITGHLSLIQYMLFLFEVLLKHVLK